MCEIILRNWGSIETHAGKYALSGTIMRVSVFYQGKWPQSDDRTHIWTVELSSSGEDELSVCVHSYVGDSWDAIMMRV